MTKWKSPRHPKYEIYQNPSRLIRWYFYKRLEVALRLSEVSAHERVVDLGFGTGFFLPTLADSAEVVIGIDSDIDSSHLPENYWADENYTDRGPHRIAQEMLETELPETRNVLLIRGDATSIPLRDASTDIVFSFGLLEHVTEPEAVIREVRRILASGGRAIFGMPVEFALPLLMRTLAGRLSGVYRESYNLTEVIQSICRNAPPLSHRRTLTTHRGYDYREDLRLVSQSLHLEAVKPVPFPPTLIAPYVVARATKW